jgi:hypothetical protein
MVHANNLTSNLKQIPLPDPNNKKAKTKTKTGSFDLPHPPSLLPIHFI